MKFPVLLFEKNDKKMYGYNYPYLWGDKRLTNTSFKNMECIDSNGDIFLIKKVEKASGILFFESIINLGLVVKYKPIYEEKGHISLVELKERVYNHVKKHPKDWSALYSGVPWKTLIDNCNTYVELIKLFPSI